MNLKESFRYQNFLDALLREAISYVKNPSHCLKVTKNHLRSKANPEAIDVVEDMESDTSFANDDVIAFMKWLVSERNKLTTSIGKAKAQIGFDFDAAIETNKFRQSVSRAIKDMLRYTPTKRVEQGHDYKFNIEGNQTTYFYEIEVVTQEAYEKNGAKSLMRSMIADADKVSTEIDSAMINTIVDYEPVFDVNETFEDVMESFAKKSLTAS